jgi:lipoprotein-releasing system ATP-binding protein
MILTANKITKIYHTDAETINVLDNLDIQINSGEIVAVVGPSGVGKSTLLHILGTLDSFDSGEITIGNELITSSTKDQPFLRSTEIGFVFQFHHLLPEFTVLENLIIPQMLIGIDKHESTKKATELLQSVKLDNRKNHYPSQISGGEKQRVAVLRALVNSPKIVLADEPTGNLDKKNSDNILDLIKVLSRDLNISFLIATHDDTILTISDRVLLLEKGKLTTLEKENL